MKDLDILLDNHRTLFVGVGNVLKSDDGVGVYICQQLEKHPGMNCLIVEASLEKYIGKINQLAPGILVLVDCMYFPGKKPGYYDLLPVKEITSFALNTHNISLGHISDFFNMPVYILGVQPDNTSFGEEMSLQIRKSADQIVRQILERSG